MYSTELPVEHDVAGEVLAERLHDLGEVAGEGTLLAGLQPSPPTFQQGDAASS
jgi:hypothetical protein